MHQSFHSTQTWTFKQRTQTVTASNRPEAFPGPTNYSTEKPAKNYGSATVGKEKRKVFTALTDSPGPGNYQYKSYTSQGPKNTISERHKITQDATPSPQTYQTKFYNVFHKAPVYSMGTKQPQSWAKRFSAVEPAPCTYNPELKYESRNGVIGNSKRKNLSQYENTPGPATYLSTPSIIQKKQPRVLIGSAIRKSIFDQENQGTTPGPGKYSTVGEIQRSSRSGRGYTMRPQTADLSIKYRSKIPGPGRYNIDRDSRQNRKGHTYGTDQRATFIDDIMKGNYTPAPGTYTSRAKQTLKTCSFATSKRKDLSDNEKTPGPAAYSTLSNSINIRTRAPGYSIGREQKGLNKMLSMYDSNPSPFNYSPSYDLIKQSSKMTKLSDTKWLRQGKGLDSPGVGTYNNFQKHQDGGSKFTRQKRKSFTDMNFYKDMPGPGQYNIKQMIPNPPKYMTYGSYKRKDQL